ncbi:MULTISPECIES: YggS family pyridoxal phosphate-dependent enzyme [unclassified Plantibacter]|uniref:YggS family pyridoxal phosphate-dependent enzyme n=1 Tax=Plantibacter sp. ME-Dv--P-095 TaxID=3040299 RepID=UPI000B1D927A|nr:MULTISPECIES: YggS family pyridoxal phosphate-dependent enzyme [unclassified Plantibacter]
MIDESTTSAGSGSSEPGPALLDRLADIRGRIADATRAAGRATEPTLIVVTKFHPVTLVQALAAAGVSDVGESRHPEARDKAAAAEGLGLRWHFIGQLQTNKAKQVRRYVDAVHSVDRPELLRALSSSERQLDVFLQVNLTDDPGRGGVVGDAALEALATAALEAEGIALRGVMAVAPLDEDPAAAFARVLSASERMRSLAPHADGLSIGMSHDYVEAIEAGATHLRIGTAITGNRPV